MAHNRVKAKRSGGCCEGERETKDFLAIDYSSRDSRVVYVRASALCPLSLSLSSLYMYVSIGEIPADAAPYLLTRSTK